MISELGHCQIQIRTTAIFCAMAPVADNASAMAATGMISARIMKLLFKRVPGPEGPSVLINLIRPGSAPRAKERPPGMRRADIRPDFDWDIRLVK